jgi:predicted PolB exonuclease-like 3'-5' exonuclease
MEPVAIIHESMQSICHNIINISETRYKQKYKKFITKCNEEQLETELKLPFERSHFTGDCGISTLLLVYRV